MPKVRQAKKRGKGEGSVYYLSDRKIWIGYQSLGKDPETGKRIRSFVYGKTQAEATQKLMETMIDRRRGKITEESREVLKSWLTRWLETYFRPFQRPNTVAKIETCIRRICKGSLALMPVSDISQDVIQRWINSLADKYASSTIQATICVLSCSMEKLVELKRLNTNPAKGIRIPLKARKPREARAMDMPTMERFLEAARTSPYYPAILFMLHTGLRSGELCALDIQDYKDPIQISKTWASAINEVQHEPKTTSSIRRVPKPKALTHLMDAYLLKLHHKKPTDPLFQTTIHPYGRLRPAHFDGVIGKIADRIGEPWITPHTLRHTFASMLFRQGVKINVVSKLLGHRDVQTTYNIYIHMVPEELDEAAEAVGGIISSCMSGAV